MFRRCEQMSKVLTEEKKNQVIALGRLGWSLRRIERETGVRRETVAGYLKAAGIGARFPGAWGRQPPAPTDSKPANELIADSVSGTEPTNEVIPDSGSGAPKQTATASASESYRELIEQALTKGRNAKAI